MNNCYVYEHWRPDKIECFYVGKGQGKRAWDGRSRNPEHLSVVQALAKRGLSIEVRIIAEGLTSAEAYSLEDKRIAFYGFANLTNRPVTCGLAFHSEDTKRKMSAARMGKKLSDWHRKRISQGAKKRGIPRHVREAQILAVTGRKRPPFTPETIAKMRIAALAREAKKRDSRG